MKLKLGEGDTKLSIVEKEKQYHRDGLPINKERPPYSGDIKFEDALDYLTQVAFEHKGEEPIIVALFGTDSVDKYRFIGKLMERFSEKDPQRMAGVYGIHIESKGDIKNFSEFRKKREDIKIPMLVLETTTNTPPDLESAMYLKRFPDTIVYMYDPKKEKIKNRKIMLGHFLEVRQKIAERFNVSYEVPEFLIVQSPEESPEAGENM